MPLETIIGLGEMTLTTEFTIVLDHTRNCPLAGALLHSAFAEVRAPSSANPVDVVFEERFRRPGGEWTRFSVVFAAHPARILPVVGSNDPARIRAKLKTGSAVAVRSTGTGISYNEWPLPA